MDILQIILTIMAIIAYGVTAGFAYFAFGKMFRKDKSIMPLTIAEMKFMAKVPSRLKGIERATKAYRRRAGATAIGTS